MSFANKCLIRLGTFARNSSAYSVPLHFMFLVLLLYFDSRSFGGFAAKKGFDLRASAKTYPGSPWICGDYWLWLRYAVVKGLLLPVAYGLLPSSHSRPNLLSFCRRLFIEFTGINRGSGARDGLEVELVAADLHQHESAIAVKTGHHLLRLVKIMRHELG